MVYTVPCEKETHILRAANMHSVQLCDDYHVCFQSALPGSEMTQHSCDPNGTNHILKNSNVMKKTKAIINYYL